MGRLQIVILAAPLALVACDGEKAAPTPPSGGRNEAVLTTASAVPSVTPPPKPVASASAAPRPPRHLCEAELQRPGRALPKTKFDVAAADGVTPPLAKLDTGAGHWTWISFFAAWCGPCKEEIPRLRAFEQRLASSLRVRFVSLDDDERQLARFLGEQPPAGVKSALWLKAGPNRDGFLSGLKLSASPSLPAHALVDPEGRLRCAFEGAIDDADFGEISAITRR